MVSLNLRRRAAAVGINEDSLPTNRRHWSIRSLSPAKRTPLTDNDDEIPVYVDSSESQSDKDDLSSQRILADRAPSPLPQTFKLKVQKGCSLSQGRRSTLTDAFQSIRRRSRSQSASPKRSVMQEITQSFAKAMKDSTSLFNKDRPKDEGAMSLLESNSGGNDSPTKSILSRSSAPDDSSKTSPINIPQQPPPSLPPLQMPSTALMNIDSTVLTGRPPPTPILVPAFPNRLGPSQLDCQAGDEFRGTEHCGSPVNEHTSMGDDLENPFDDIARVNQELQDLHSADDNKDHSVRNSEETNDPGYHSDVESLANLANPCNTPASCSTRSVRVSHQVLEHNDGQMKGPSQAHFDLKTLPANTIFRVRNPDQDLHSSTTEGKMTKVDANGNDQDKINERVDSQTSPFSRGDQRKRSADSTTLFDLHPLRCCASKMVCEICCDINLAQRLPDLESRTPSIENTRSSSDSRCRIDKESTMSENARTLTLRRRTSGTLSRSPGKSRRPLRFSNKAQTIPIEQNSAFCNESLASLDDVKHLQGSEHTEENLPTELNSLPSEDFHVQHAGLPYGDRFLDQYGWSPFTDEAFGREALKMIERSPGRFGAQLCMRGGFLKFWQEAHLSEKTAPRQDTECLSNEDVELLKNLIQDRFSLPASGSTAENVASSVQDILRMKNVVRSEVSSDTSDLSAAISATSGSRSAISSMTLNLESSEDNQRVNDAWTAVAVSSDISSSNSNEERAKLQDSFHSNVNGKTVCRTQSSVHWDTALYPVHNQFIGSSCDNAVAPNNTGEPNNHFPENEKPSSPALMTGQVGNDA